RTYRVAGVARTLRAALRSGSKGLKVVIADGECQLARQRRLRPETARKLAAGERVVRTRFWVDPEVCTGDHSCIRLSGCPSLTIKPTEDRLRSDPVAHVNNDCVGCGLCGEVAHAAQLLAMRSTRLANAVPSRSMAATFQPAWRSRATVARPMPDPAPV